MPSIDERIVAMSFENAQFEQRISVTLASLGKLDQAVKNIHGAEGLENIEKSGNKVTLRGPLAALEALRSRLSRSGEGAAQGLGEIERAGQKVVLEQPNKALDKVQSRLGQLSAGSTFSDIEKASHQVEFSGLTKAIESVSGRFSLMQQAASVAMGNIVSQATMRGAAFAKSFAIGPITDGLHEYETNLKSIQTILANTQGQKVTGLDNVNKYLAELNEYSDQTIYNFSEMAKNIGTFTAAGVDLPKATASIKGIANLAALSGSNSQQASTAMYQLSQAIAAGKVGLQDWNSVVNAGMGGAVFQKALMRTAENLGSIEKGALKIDKATGKATVNGQSFRESIMAKPGQESWLTSDVLTNTLEQFTNDMTAAELKAQGFSDAQVKAIQDQSKMAKAAATEVKTLGQVWDVARETVGSGWSKTFQLIFGDFKQAKTLFTGMSNFINGWINGVSDARNKMFEDWQKLGGRDDLLAGLKQAFSNVMSIIKPIRDAFRDIFPSTTGAQLAEFTKNFASLMNRLKPSEPVIDNIRRIFRGLFAVLDIGWEIVKGVIGVILDLVGAVSGAGGGFLEFAAGVGDFLVAVRDALTQGDALKKFFEGLGAVLKVPLNLIISLARAIANLFTGSDPRAADGLNQALDNANARLGPLKRVIEVVVEAWDKLTGAMGAAKTALEPWFDKLVDTMSGFADSVANVFKNMSFDQVMSAIQTGLIGGILVMLKKQLGSGGVLSSLSGTLDGLGEVFAGLTGNLEAMQKNVQAKTIATIAAAILVLAGAVFVLSRINAEDLSKSMLAIAVGLGQLMGAMKLMMAGMGKLGFAMFPLIAAGLIGLSVALVVLTGAIKLMSTLEWEEIGKGLLGVGGAIAVIGRSMALMPKGPYMALQAAALILIGVALNAIAAAVKTMGAMKFEDIGKGLFTLVTALAGIGTALSLMPPNTIASAAALMIVGVALNAIGRAIGNLGKLDLLTLVKGIGAVMAAIAGIGLALSLMPPHIALMAAGLLIVGQALVVTAGAIALLGKLSLGTLVKGIVGLGAALATLAVGLTLMIASAPGAVALMAAAAALAVLVPVIGLLGSMEWSTIFKGMATIAAVMVTIGVAGLVAAPALLALGLALIPLGAGFMLVATAASIFAKAVALLSTEGQAGLAVFMTALTGFALLLPKLIIDTLKGLVTVVGEIVKIAPAVVEAIGKLLSIVIQFISDNAVKLAMAIGLLVDGIVLVLIENIPKLVRAGFQLLQGLLDGLSQNIGSVTNKVSEVIVKFLDALRVNMPKLVDAGARTLVSFINGISSKFGELASTVGTMIGRFATAVASQYTRMVQVASNLMLQFIGGIAKMIPNLVGKAAGIILAVVDGLGTNANKIVARGADVIIKFIQGITSNMKRIADKGADAVIEFLNGIAESIRTKGPELRQAGWNVAEAIVEGIWQGIQETGGKVMKAIKWLAGQMPGWMRKVLGIKSPSTVFAEIGRYSMAGVVKGVTDEAPKVRKETEAVGRYSMQGMAKGLDDNRDLVVSSALNTAGMMVGSLRKVLKIRSPSEVFREIGMNVNRGFKEGLKGSESEVLSAFDSMNSSLIDKIRDLRTQVEDGNGRLEDLQRQHAEKMAEIARARQEKKPDKDAIADMVKESEALEQQIREETSAVNQNEKALTTARNTRKLLNDGLDDEKARLVGLKREYEGITTQLEDASRALDEAIKNRADAQSKYTNQYNTPPDIEKLVSDAMADAELTYEERTEKIRKAREEAEKRRRIDQVALYKKALQEQIVATAKYQATLQKLRELGLDDATYTKLLDRGLEGQEFADQLLSSGKKGVDEINKMNAELLQKSTDLAKQAADNLYNAGVQAAQGLVDGLTQKKADLEKAMNSLADAMVNQIKAKLKIKSPSRVFMEVGKFTAQGLAQGMRNSTQTVTGAAEALGDDATSALKSSLSNILDTVSGEIDPELVITPVLDLTQLQKDARGIGDFGNVIPITAATSYGQASAASQEVSAAQLAAYEANVALGPPSVEFNQYNSSPKALDEVEIYRNTKNQMGQIKSALGVPVSA